MSKNENQNALKKSLGLAGILCLVLVLICSVGCKSSELGESKKHSNPFSSKERKLNELETQIDTLYGEAEKAQRSGKTHEARKAYEQIVDIYDKNKNNKDLKREVEPYCRLGMIMETFGQYDKAEDYYRQAIAVDQKNPAPLNSLGYCYLNQQRLDDAIEYFHKAIDLAPMEPKYNNNLALAYGLKKDYGQAFKYFRRVSSEDVTYYNMSAIFAMNHDDERAKSALQQVVAINPNHREAQRMLSTYQEAEQNPESFNQQMMAGGYTGTTVPYQPAPTSGAVGNYAAPNLPANAGAPAAANTMPAAAPAATPAAAPATGTVPASSASSMPGTAGTPAFTKTYGSIHHLR